MVEPWRETVKSLSAVELLLLLLWCLLAMLQKLLNLGFIGIDYLVGEKFQTPRPLKAQPLQGIALTVKPSKATTGISRSRSELLEPTSRWKQVASYTPGPIEEEGNGVLAQTHTATRSKSKRDSKCNLCPGICECREYLTKEQWRAKSAAVFCKG